MSITKEEIQKLKKIYRDQYVQDISDQEAVDIITRLVNILIIIYNDE